MLDYLNANYTTKSISFDCGDTMEKIQKSELVITDFSSVAVDAAVTYNCKVILFYNDIEMYCSERGIYENLSNLMSNELDFTNTLTKEDFKVYPSNVNCSERIIFHIKAYL
ncbi:hypothetical protein VSU01S_31040 [Vibrio superstes NBRC 103154]|uniref:CDP-glycerol--glycerophosphate glycerophosphotransferase n=2 Tax=Vibrio superstes TaxID=198815 RepID=A0A511QU24_9VIBR|nr:hypothetical protein VSU01S_31040 [Vibrio superstes NBRC 103154]